MPAQKWSHVAVNQVKGAHLQSQHTDVHGQYPDPWKVGVIKRMHKRCVPGSFLPSPKSLGTRLL